MTSKNCLLARRAFSLFFVLISALALYGQAQPGGYPAALSGGSYMHNFYIPPPTVSTPWSPDWAPDGKSIAVAMNGSIWKVDPATGRAVELTYSEKYHNSPDWSPDGKWLIYTADDGGKTVQLEILDTVSSKSHKLTDDYHLYLDPVFSPDGQRVAYVSTKPNGYFNVYVRSIKNGKWASEPLAITSDRRTPTDRLYFGRWDMHITPAWFPDGNELLLVSNRNVPLGSGHALRVPVEANGIEKAITVLAEQTLYRTRPDVSIDSKRFVFSSTRGAADQFSNLYVQPTTGGQPYKLTFFQHDAFHPRWSPDGEWIAYIENEGGLPQLALLETYGGERRKVSITERQWKRPTGKLLVRTRHQDTDKIVGVRVYLKASDGKAYAPAESYGRLTAVGEKVFHSFGEFEIELPVGTVELLFLKGFEFKPERIEANIEADRHTTLEVTLEPLTDMAEKGWYSASTHVHMNYGGNMHNSLENLMLVSEAEDQDLLLHQIANKDNRILDYQFFVPGGKSHPLSTKERLVVVGQEYRPPLWGHVFMFGMTDHLISPFANGYEGTGIASHYPSNTDMFRKARNQGAWVGYVHSFRDETDPLEADLGGAKGMMVDVALGTTDAVELSTASRAAFYPLYAVWNNGLRVSVCGGEDSISDLHWSKQVGSFRTYVHTGDEGLDMNAWFSGLKSGHAFVSGGPLLEFTVNGKMPGETILLPENGGDVRIEAKVQCITPLEKILLVRNGEVIEEIPLGEDRMNVEFSRNLRVEESGWYHLRAEGSMEERYPLDTLYAQAYTNPVWITVGGQPIRDEESAEYSLRWIDKLEAIMDADRGWRSQKEKDHVFAQFEEARNVYRQFAREARSRKGSR